MRVALVVIALAFLGAFLVLPLVAVFAQALEKGLAAYSSAIREPMALSALRLTLLTAAVAVSLTSRSAWPLPGPSRSSISGAKTP